MEGIFQKQTSFRDFPTEDLFLVVDLIVRAINFLEKQRFVNQQLFSLCK